MSSLIEVDYGSDDLTSRQYKSNYTVSLSDKFETLDFTVKQSKFSEHHYASRKHSYLQFYAFRWLIVILTAVVMGTIHFIMVMGIKLLSYEKLQWLIKITIRFPQEIWLTYIGLAGFNMLCMAVASGSCILFAMEAVGGNVSGVMAYLNGTRIKRLFTARTVLVKMLSTTAMICTGTPGGLEGPVIHMGAAVGNIIPNYVAKFIKLHHSHAFNYLCNICEKRDLSVCGIAAGVSAGFGAPFGGVFLALEETTSYFSADMLPRIAVCSFLAKFVSDCLNESFLHSELGSAEKYYKLLPHLDVSHLVQTENIGLLEILIPVMFGLLGAFFGVLFIILFNKQLRIRKKLALNERKKYLFCEALINAMIIALFYVTMAAIFSHQCTQEKKTEDSLRFSCPEGSVPVISYFMITFEDGYRSLVQTEPGVFPVRIIFLVFIFLYTFSIFSSSHCYSSGFFMIHFMLGALWGRIIGEALHTYYPQASADPRKLSLLGAAAQITGMARSQISIVCLLLESSNTFQICVIEIFITTLITKIISNLCVPSIYHVQLDVIGISFLESEVPTGTSADVADILSSDREMFTSDLVPRVGHLYDLTQEEKGNFPIVTSEGKILGDISCCLIYKLLASNVYDANQPYPEQRYPSLYRIIYSVECTIDYMKDIRQEMLLHVSEADRSKYLDLTPFLNKNLFYVRPNASLHHIYEFFRQIGMRTLYIVDETETLRGIITRKYLARYRTHRHMGRLHREKVKVPSRQSSRSRSPVSPQPPPQNNDNPGKEAIE